MHAATFSTILMAGAALMPPAGSPVSIQRDDLHGSLDGICTRQGVLEVHPDRDLLWDNSVLCLGGKSHKTAPGQRRSILDDFKVPASGWTMDTVHIKFAWADGSTGTGLDFELIVFGDDDGRPDFDNLVAIPQNRTYHEVRDPYDPEFFGLTVVDIWVTFDPVVLEPGRYWIDMHVVSPVHGFQVDAWYPQLELESIWVDYEDFGGRQPGTYVFGDYYDSSLWIFGERHCKMSCPVWPDALALRHGSLRSGAVEDLRESDDQYVTVEPRPSVTPTMPIIRLDLETVTSYETTASFTLSVESAANSIPSRPPQRISLFDFDLGSWEVVDERTTSFDDATATIEVTGNAERFAEARTTRMLARLEYFNPGNVIRPSWTVRLDRVLWEIAP